MIGQFCIETTFPLACMEAVHERAAIGPHRTRAGEHPCHAPCPSSRVASVVSVVSVVSPVSVVSLVSVGTV
jgi:hypothetical protein